MWYPKARAQALFALSPKMLLTNEQAEERLNSTKNLANRFRRAPRNISIVEKPEGGTVTIRGNKLRSPDNLPPFLLTTIGVLAAQAPLTGALQKDIAAEFEVDQSRVSEIKNGLVKTADNKAIAASFGQTRDLAMDRLMTALHLMDDDKLSACKATDLSKISADMSKVVEKTMPRDSSAPQINLTIYAPSLRDESKFSVVEVTSNQEK